MTNDQLKDLKDRLWKGADQLRANSHLKSTEYATPILGLIFLHFAQSKYSKYEDEINAEYEKNQGSRAARQIHEIAIEKCGFYLPPEAKFDYLLHLPESEDLAKATQIAMEQIERYNESLVDILPKNEYHKINSGGDPHVLAKLFKVFKDIPTDVSLDIFGEIYEYFLGEFALAEGQGGGEFFTPSTVVRYMVEVLAPTEGEIFDPACGSGGMFVQTAHYIARHAKNGNNINLRAYGVEKTGATVKLAKMNLVLHNIRGDISEGNTYYADPHTCFGRFHYVMANPPFNVDEVELDKVKQQPRYNTYGIPQNKSKKQKGSVAETVPNANYLWINLFATSLNEQGRAALVMANSASDAGHSEKDIRIKLIESGIISQIVALPTNMFTSVTLPATLWFFDKAKAQKNEILFLDARNVFTQIDRSHRKFSDEQIKNIAVITRLYQGKHEDFQNLINEYLSHYPSLLENIDTAIAELLKYELFFDKHSDDKYAIPQKNSFADSGLFDDCVVKGITCNSPSSAKDLLLKLENLKKQTTQANNWLNSNTQITKGQNQKVAIFNQHLKDIDKYIEECTYWLENYLWLITRFPDGKYTDVIGLCKVAKLNGEDGIKDQDYSLNPGRYVGVVIEDDGMTAEEFKAQMRALNEELVALNAEAHELEKTIADNILYLLGDV